MQTGYPNYPNNDAPPPYTVATGMSAGPAPQTQATVNIGNEPTDDKFKSFGFSLDSIRSAFIRKVYGVLLAQLGFSLIFILWFTFHMPTRRHVLHNSVWLYVALVVVIACSLAITFYADIRRKSPIKYIFTAVFTLAESVLLGYAAATLSEVPVLVAVGLCIIACLGLTLFAFKSKWDLTERGDIIFYAVIGLILFGFVAIFINLLIIRMLYAVYGTVLFCVCFVFDTQLMAGNRKLVLSTEEHIFAATNQYMNVVCLFLNLVVIIGGCQLFVIYIPAFYAVLRKKTSKETDTITQA